MLLLTYIARRQGLAGRSNKSNQQQQPGKGGTPPPTGQYSQSPTSQQPPQPPMPHSPAMSASMSFDAGSESPAQSGNRRPPFFFREEYSNLIVKGNFMTLAAKPKLVEEGEWLAHQGRSHVYLELSLADHVTSRRTVPATRTDDRGHQGHRRPHRQANL